MVKISAFEARIISELLQQHADEFSNHGCNDFNIKELMPNETARKLLMAEIITDDPEYAERCGVTGDTQDWLLSAYFARKLKPKTCEHEWTTDEGGTGLVCVKIATRTGPHWDRRISNAISHYSTSPEG